MLKPNEEIIAKEDVDNGAVMGPVQLRHARYDEDEKSWVKIKPIWPTSHSRWTGTESVMCPDSCPEDAYHWDA